MQMQKSKITKIIMESIKDFLSLRMRCKNTLKTFSELFSFDSLKNGSFSSCGFEIGGDGS